MRQNIAIKPQFDLDPTLRLPMAILAAVFLHSVMLRVRFVLCDMQFNLR